VAGVVGFEGRWRAVSDRVREASRQGQGCDGQGLRSDGKGLRRRRPQGLRGRRLATRAETVRKLFADAMGKGRARRPQTPILALANACAASPAHPISGLGKGSCGSVRKRAIPSGLGKTDCGGRSANPDPRLLGNALAGHGPLTDHSRFW